MFLNTLTGNTESFVEITSQQTGLRLLKFTCEPTCLQRSHARPFEHKLYVNFSTLKYTHDRQTLWYIHLLFWNMLAERSEENWISPTFCKQYKSMGAIGCCGNQFWSNLRKSLMQPFPYPSDATHKIWLKGKDHKNANEFHLEVFWKQNILMQTA